MRVVLDCNVLISAAYSANGPCRAVINTVIKGHDCIISESLLREYLRVSVRPKHLSITNEIEVLIALLSEFSIRVGAAESPFKLKQDPSDEIYLAAAFAGQADVLVTGNLKDFPDSRYGKTVIVSPRQFLDMVE